MGGPPKGIESGGYGKKALALALALGGGLTWRFGLFRFQPPATKPVEDRECIGAYTFSFDRH